MARMTAASRQFVAHALATEWADLAPATRAAARTFLHDSLAVGIAGRNAPFADAVFRTATGWSGTGGTGFVPGRPGARLTAPHAAFVTAYQIHAQEYDLLQILHTLLLLRVDTIVSPRSCQRSLKDNSHLQCHTPLPLSMTAG